MAGRVYPWDAAKAYYINSGWLSGVSFQTVAEKYGIPYQSVRRRAAKEKWRLIREWQSIEPDLESLDEYIEYYK